MLNRKQDACVKDDENQNDDQILNQYLRSQN